MTEDHSNPQDEGSVLDMIDKLDMADLRKFTALSGIKAERTWEKKDYIAALKKHQDDEHKASLVINDANAPAPGYARVLIHRDPTPNHKNKPIHVSVNGHLFGIPRGVAVDVPLPFVEALSNAKSNVMKQDAEPSRSNPGGVYTEEEQLSYPFQVMAITPGPYKNPHDSRAKSFAIRKQFHSENGVWPTTGELSEYRKARALKA